MSYNKICPMCKGNGRIIERIDASFIYGYYSDGTSKTADYGIDCPLCNGGKSNRVERAKNNSGIPTMFQNMGIDKFDWNHYRDSDNKVIDTTIQKNYVHNFVYNFEYWQQDNKWLYIYSYTKGSGKTMLSSCICNSIIENYGTQCIFVSASELMALDKSADNKAPNRWERDPVGKLCECQLLVIDDLGVEDASNKWVYQILFRIIDARVQNNLVTILTSNLKMSELSIGDRIVQRIYDCSFPIHLPEYSVRMIESRDKKRDFAKKMGLCS